MTLDDFNSADELWGWLKTATPVGHLTPCARCPIPATHDDGLCKRHTSSATLTFYRVNADGEPELRSPRLKWIPIEKALIQLLPGYEEGWPTHYLDGDRGNHHPDNLQLVPARLLKGWESISGPVPEQIIKDYLRLENELDKQISKWASQNKSTGPKPKAQFW